MATKVVEPPRQGRGHASTGPAAWEINWRNPSDQELVAFVQNQAKDHDARHLWWVRRAKVNLAWAAGEQLKVWDNLSGRLMDSFDVQADRIALFVNKLKPTILNYISMVTARGVSFRVTPSTPEDDDVASAHVQDKLARHYFSILLHDEKFLEALWMMYCTGIVFFRSTWDQLAGDSFSISAEDMGVGKGPKGQVLSRFRDTIAKIAGLESPDDVVLDASGGFNTGTGDLVCDMLTGFEVIPPFRATSVENAHFLITRQYANLEEVQARYGKKKTDKLTPNYVEPYFSYQDYEGFEHWQEHSLNTIKSSTQSPDHVLVYEVWRPKTKWVPDGHHGVVCQGQVLKKDHHPYDHGEIPVVGVKEHPSPKKFWPSSTVYDLMSLQSEINVTRSQVAEHKAATIQPRIIAEKGIGLDEMAFTKRNEIVEVRAGSIDRVKPWVPEPLPAYISWWEQSLRNDWEDVSRNHSASYGKQKGTVKSGKHAMALQEADARVNTPMMRLIKRSMALMCKQWMSILHQFVDEERVITITGENGEPEVIRWSNANVPFAENNVTCELGPNMDRSSTLELIDMLSARGWINPQSSEDRYTVYRWLGDGIAHQIDETQNDRRNATMENDQMLNGMLPMVVEGDDDTTHLLEHFRVMKTATYRKVVEQAPKIDEQFRIHITAHEQQRLRKQIRQKIYAQQIEMEMLQSSGLAQQMAALAPPPEPSGSPSQGKPSPSGGGANRPGTAKPPVNRNKKQRPVRASRKGPAAPPGYENRGSLLIPEGM